MLRECIQVTYYLTWRILQCSRTPLSCQSLNLSLCSNLTLDFEKVGLVWVLPSKTGLNTGSPCNRGCSKDARGIYNTFSRCHRVAGLTCRLWYSKKILWNWLQPNRKRIFSCIASACWLVAAKAIYDWMSVYDCMFVYPELIHSVKVWRPKAWTKACYTNSTNEPSGLPAILKPEVWFAQTKAHPAVNHKERLRRRWHFDRNRPNWTNVFCTGGLPSKAWQAQGKGGDSHLISCRLIEKMWADFEGVLGVRRVNK